MRFTVLNTPQGIYSDGLQDSVTLQNLGSSTIYLSDDSAISSISYPLPPTASIVWDSGRPLWAVCRTTTGSTLQVDRASSLMDRAKADAYVNLANYVPGARNNNTTFSPGDILECASFKTLLVTLSSDSSFTIAAPTNIMILACEWFDQNQNSIFTQSLSWPFSSDFGIPSSLTIPVRGAFVRMTLRNQTGSQKIFSYLNVVGTTLEQGLTIIPGTYASCSGNSVGGTWRDAFVNTWDGTVFIVPAWSSFITISIRYSSNITSPGRFDIKDAVTGDFLDQIAQGNTTAASTNYYERRFSPKTILLFQMGVIPTGPPITNIHITWPNDGGMS